MIESHTLRRIVPHAELLQVVDELLVMTKAKNMQVILQNLRDRLSEGGVIACKYTNRVQFVMSESPTITYTLEEFLLRFEQRIDRQFAELNQRMNKLDEKIDRLDEKMDRQYAELNQKMDRQYAELNQKMDKQDAELNQKVSDLALDIKGLDERVKGIDKRLETLEFILRGGVVAFLTGSVGLLLNAFGVFSQLKS